MIRSLLGRDRNECLLFLRIVVVVCFVSPAYPITCPVSIDFVIDFDNVFFRSPKISAGYEQPQDENEV